ncbi:MAG: GFA family protein [Amaricoccus sp.]
MDWSLPREGGCRCGRVRFRVTAPPLVTVACHCRGCQRMTASAFSLSAPFPRDGFAVIEGEPVIGGLHGADAQHYFCGWCMSWCYSRIQGLEFMVNVRASLFDDPAGLDPFVETCRSEGFGWAATGAIHSFAQFPPDEAWPGLMEEFAARD